MTEIKELHDSGKRREFASGAVRDRGGRKPRPDLISPHAQMREGMIMTLGGEKYDLRNWEKGMPISECVASAQRHIEDYKLGLTNEDHLAQARWNLGAILHYEEEIKAGRMDPAIDDMPKYAQQDTLGTCPNAPDLDNGECISVGDLVHELDTIPSDHRIVHVPREDEIPTFYIAGPMRGYRFFNFPAFDEARDRGIALGYNIISPADLDRANSINPLQWPIEMIAWYDTNGWMDIHPKHKRPNLLREIIRRDTEAIITLEPKNNDGIALLLDWEKSTGACVEGPLAKWCGLRIVSAENFETPIEV